MWQVDPRITDSTDTVGRPRETRGLPTPKQTEHGAGRQTPRLQEQNKYVQKDPDSQPRRNSR